MEYVKIVPAQNGRQAVLIRKDENSPWVQVESCLTRTDADDLVQMYGYEDDAAKRAEDAAEYANEEWGDDAPVAS